MSECNFMEKFQANRLRLSLASLTANCHQNKIRSYHFLFDYETKSRLANCLIMSATLSSDILK